MVARLRAKKRTVSMGDRHCPDLHISCAHRVRLVHSYRLLPIRGLESDFFARLRKRPDLLQVQPVLRLSC